MIPEIIGYNEFFYIYRFDLDLSDIRNGYL